MDAPLRIAIVSIADNDFRYPIIGPTIIAKSVKDNCKEVKVRLIDNTFEEVYKEVKKFNPEIIGFSTFTQSYQRAIDFAKTIKNEIPNIKLIIGGPHITTLPESFNPIFDFGIIGEGQNSFPEFRFYHEKHSGKNAFQVFLASCHNQLFLFCLFSQVFQETFLQHQLGILA